MAQFIGSILCLLIAFVTWGLLFGLMAHGVPSLGNTSGLDWLLFLGPVVGFGLPASAVAFFKVGAVGGMLCIALIPLLAPLNFFIAVVISSSHNLSQALVTYALSALWLLPFPVMWGFVLVKNSRAT